MLFSYVYVPHPMERLQSFIDFIFHEVWCKAPGNGIFRFELFDALPELKSMMESLFYGHTQGGDFFYGHVERIFGLFAALAPAEIAQLGVWYQANNEIERVCENDPQVQIARYHNIAALHPALNEQLASFYKGLYSHINIAAVVERTGRIDDHYRAFMQVNVSGKCPFCGLGDMLGIYHTKREAYDHYLPKGLYPFNSVNFRNLVPACHHCNSTYKATQDPTYQPKDPGGPVVRRKTFYPYSTGGHSISVELDLSTLEIDHLTPADIHFRFGPPAVLEEIETWKDVYGIEERYKAKCCSEDAKVWLEEIRIWRDSQGTDPATSIATIKQLTDASPVANSNFLKLAFLESCQREGLFEVAAHNLA
jgi:hypothetical protein